MFAPLLATHSFKCWHHLRKQKTGADDSHFINSLFNPSYKIFGNTISICWLCDLIPSWDPSIMSVHSNALLSLESRALEHCPCHAGHAYITGFWLLSVARESIQPVHLTYPAHGSLSACPLPCCWHPDRNDTNASACYNYFSLATKVHMKQRQD